MVGVFCQELELRKVLVYIYQGGREAVEVSFHPGTCNVRDRVQECKIGSMLTFRKCKNRNPSL